MRRQLVLGIIGGVVAVLYLTGALDFIERHLHDLRSAMLSRPASGEIVLVTIDRRSLQRLPGWPWPREYHARVIERLIDAGATKIAVAVDFSTPSDVRNDRRLASALARAGPNRVALPVFRQLGDEADEVPHVVEPLPLFRQHSALASADVWPDQDGLVRRFDTHQNIAGASIPTVPGWLLSERENQAKGNLIDFSIEPSTIPRISFVDVLEGTFDLSRMAGKKRVLIGATAVELGDEVSVPRHRLLPGAVLQALIAETLLQQRAIRPVAGWPVALLGALIALAVGWLLSKLEWRRGTAIAAATAVLVIGISLLLHLAAGTSLHTSPVLLNILLGALAALLDSQVSMILAQRLALRRKDAVMGRLVDAVFDGIVTFDHQGKVLSWNRAAERMFGDPIEQVSGQPLEALLPLLGHSHAAQGTLAPRELLAKRSDGSHFPAEVAVSATEIEGMRIGVAVVRDITKRKADEELARQALHDSLTGLPNRAFLLNRIGETTLDVERSREPFGLLILDLDGFKQINDRLGHRVGDLVLRDLAPRLQEPLRRGDLVARLGGDEFAILLSPPTDAKTAFAVAGRINHCVRQPLLVEGMCFRLSASIGIALHPRHGHKAGHLLHCADTAMYTAKRDRLRVALYDLCETAIGKDFALRDELNRAIKQSELVLHYQPKIDVRSLQLVGLEALVRWQHPEYGLLPPDRFIPLAECTDLIQPLTDWVLNAAIRQQHLWQKSGYDVGVAVNLSAKSLLDPQLANRFRAICDRWGVPPGRIICEITESSVIGDPKSASRVLMRLAKMGCKVSLDDFGTGYSSLVHLQALPISELKINRSFVLSMSTDQNASTIVRTIVNLAHTLGMQVVAEGVEDRAAFTRLTVIGCDQVQGHLFGRPVAAGELEDLLQKSLRSSGSSAAAVRRGTRVAAPLAVRVGSLQRGSVASLGAVLQKPGAA